MISNKYIKMSKAVRLNLEMAMAYMQQDTPYNSPDAFRVLKRVLGYEVDADCRRIEETDAGCKE